MFLGDKCVCKDSLLKIHIDSQKIKIYLQKLYFKYGKMLQQTLSKWLLTLSLLVNTKTQQKKKQSNNV